MTDKNNEFATIYPLSMDGEIHSVVRMPSSFTKEGEETTNTENIFNILMADVSGSMYGFWKSLQEGWNSIVCPVLTGHTKIYSYGDIVQFLREDSPLLKAEDFLSTGTEDFTSALITVMKEINECKETYVRAFIISDGAHCLPGEKPDSVIEKMEPPTGKTVEVYILGVGMGFPVQYSIDIRSRLHNGPTNIPYIFWPKEPKDINEQMTLIKNEISNTLVEFEISTPGCLLPGIDEISKVRLGEWIYFKSTPDGLRNLCISSEGYQIPMQDSELELDDMKALFSQWNKIILQRHKCNKSIDKGIFDVMDGMYKEKLKKLNPVSSENLKGIAKRMHDKEVKRIQTDYATLINQSKSLIETDEKYKNEMELAEILVTTTTGGKYREKSLKLKGHTCEDFAKDIEEFKEIYLKNKDKIMKLPMPDPDDCCRITVSSTISDLQDDGLELLFKENKFEFLKNFTITGIPILTDLLEFAVMNPWVIRIKNILVNPFEILSQQALEFGAENSDLEDRDKSIILKQDDESTRFNAIIPVFPKGSVDLLKPLLITKIFTICCTFSISKNVHLIDHTCHIAALACVWIHTIYNYSKENRPEFITKRIELIEETSKIYMGRKSLKSYVKSLIENTGIALTTERDAELDDDNNENSGKIKCESLTKPTFLLYLYRNVFDISVDKKIEILKLLLAEYIGRCRSHNATFSSVFITEKEEKEEKQEEFDPPEFCVSRSLYKITKAAKARAEQEPKKWHKDIAEKICAEFKETGDELIKQFYTPEILMKKIKADLISIDSTIKSHLGNLDVNVDYDKVYKAEDYGSNGDITLASIKAWAREIDVPESDIDFLFSKEMINTYLYHSVKYKYSKDRMSNPIISIENVQEAIIKELLKENIKSIKVVLWKILPDIMKKRWREAYLNSHCSFILPMTQEEIIEIATNRNIKVDASTFDQVYKYRKNVGLLRNACMSTKCPHYLEPKNNFNQHISIEREFGNFPHNLHNIAFENSASGAEEIVSMIKNKKLKRSYKEHAETRSDLDKMIDGVPQLIDYYSAK